METVDNRHSLCRGVGLEPPLNLAVLQFDVPLDGSGPRFSPIVFGHSYPLQPGHLTVSMGDPFGPEKLMNMGLLAATPSRECYQEKLTASHLHVVLQAHPGAYGGGADRPARPLRGHACAPLRARGRERGWGE